jgi:twinkle protein
VADILDFPSSSGIPNVYWVEDGPQRGSVEDCAFGIGWQELDELFKFYLGQFTVVTGLPSSGKSTFMFNAVIKLAREKGIRSFLYVPENEGYLKNKLRKLWTGDSESFRYFCSAQCMFLSSYVDANEPPHTMQWVLERAALAVVRHKIELVVIDPWNELDRARKRDELMTDYIGRCLMDIKDFVRTMDVMVVVVAHPTKAVNEGNRVPNLSDIEGSANWWNKCDNGLILHRPDLTKHAVRIISAKVREFGAGRIGEAYFNVDPKTGIFTPQYGAVST